MREIEVDCFAGGGGASLGMRRANGRCPAVAINHDPAAIAMHTANHPRTKHFTEDVWKLSPHEVTRGRPVGLFWASPDCKHFSRAKGGKPVEKGIRSLAWVVIKWAVQERPRVIVLENVREFEDWGPLVPRWECRGCDWRGTEGQAVLARKRRRCPRCDSTSLRETQDLVPDPARKGLTFKRFVGRLRNLGYAVEWKVLNAADYGAPTHRRRLFLIARCDKRSITWPVPTHGDPKRIGANAFEILLKPWRTAAECIDWSIPCPSIFERKRPLAEATLRRIALGIKRYVLENPKPFIVGCGGPAHAGEPRGSDRPMGVVMPKNSSALVSPQLVRFRGSPDGKPPDIDRPVPTITAGSHNSRPAGAGHALGIATPVLARMCQTNGNGKYANRVDEPLTTIVSKAEHLLVSPTLIQTGYGEREGQAPRAMDIEAPLGTAVAGGTKAALVAAFLAKHYGGSVGQDLQKPASTVTARAHDSLIAANLVHLNRGDTAVSGCDDPLRTATASGNHAALVYSFLVKYFGTAIGQNLLEPLHTVTEKDRFGLVYIMIDGEAWVIVDIGMRMLTPRELARGQGFPDSYALTGTQSNQVARIGNSVPPDVAEKIVRANYVARGRKRKPVLA